MHAQGHGSGSPLLHVVTDTYGVLLFESVLREQRPRALQGQTVHHHLAQQTHRSLNQQLVPQCGLSAGFQPVRFPHHKLVWCPPHLCPLPRCQHAPTPQHVLGVSWHVTVGRRVPAQHSTAQPTAQHGIHHSTTLQLHGMAKAEGNPKCLVTLSGRAAQWPALVRGNAPAQVNCHSPVPVCPADTELCLLAPDQDERRVEHQGLCLKGHASAVITDSGWGRRLHEQLPVDYERPDSDRLCQADLYRRQQEGRRCLSSGECTV